MKNLLKAIIIIVLTILTQVGGVIYVLNEVFWRKRNQKRGVKIIVFILAYCFSTFVLVPQLAKIGGRQALPVLETKGLQPLNVLTCLLNRHYVKNEMYELITSTAQKMKSKQSVINYLDANFPFFDGFPLLPHLSHKDGKKLDLAFFYKNTEDGSLSNSAPSFIGYGVSVESLQGEENTTQFCEKQGFWQYGLLNKLVSQSKKDDFIFDEKRTKDLLKLVLKDKRTGKVFIEPHLIERMNLKHNKLRFHGCHAVRHDDHIHIQLK